MPHRTLNTGADRARVFVLLGGNSIDSDIAVTGVPNCGAPGTPGTFRFTVFEGPELSDPCTVSTE